MGIIEQNTIELIDPGGVTEWALRTNFLNTITSVAGSTNIGWNYVVDYSWIMWQFEKWRQVFLTKAAIKSGRPREQISGYDDAPRKLVLKNEDLRKATILDIGCGPCVLHYYLEYTYGVNIVGVDRQEEWGSAASAVDVVGDITDPEVQQAALKGKKADLILAISTFEYNDYDGHKAAVDACMDLLAPGGWLIATVSANPESTFSDSQWDLSPKELGEIYRAEPPQFYGAIHRRWRGHRTLMKLYYKRYKRWDDSCPHFVVAGAVMRKGK